MVEISGRIIKRWFHRSAKWVNKQITVWSKNDSPATVKSNNYVFHKATRLRLF